ncbi:xylanase [Coprinopsis sp. MPI-PUGE-AT-0042]|nr:xylanase [Coprinopsis sp. MPI-PUGE-AT-0042]
MKLSALIITSTGVVGALASAVLNAGEGTPSSSGVHNGFFYLWQSETGNNANYTNEDAGTYSVEWSSLLGLVTGGKGWSPATRGRVVNYNGTYQYNGQSFVGVYGWTRKPLVEYWIIENYGSLNPASSAHRIGNATCMNNGIPRIYDLYQETRVNQPSIDGTQKFKKYWSIRRQKASPSNLNGTIDTECHFQGWKDGGFEIGEELVYQIFATEGYFSSGKVTMTVS